MGRRNVHEIETPDVHFCSKTSSSGSEGGIYRRENIGDACEAEPHCDFRSREKLLHRIWSFSFAILLIGTGISIAFVATGINSIRQHHKQDFVSRSQTVIRSVSSAWSAYEVAGLMIHNSCRAKETDRDKYLSRGICSRSTFADLYTSLVFSDLDFEAISWVVNATQIDRVDLENESADYIDEHASLFPGNYSYVGFLGYEPDAKAKNGLSPMRRSVHDFYYVAHYILPIFGSYAYATDFDLNTNPTRQAAIENALQLSRPALSEPEVLYGDVVDVIGNSVVLFHPGLPNASSNELSMVVVRVQSILHRAIQAFENTQCSTIIYDVTDPQQRLLVGGVEIQANGEHANYFSQRDLANFKKNSKLQFHKTISIANRYWEITVVGECNLQIVLLLVGGFIMFMACASLAIWYVTSARREFLLNEAQSALQAEKAALIVKNAKMEVKAERELNDFVAHEVRNPLAAALSACSFIAAACNENPPLQTEDIITSVREDIAIISTCLSYINDLLRNMIDLHKVGSNQIAVDLVPLDLERDILAPVCNLLYRRGDDIDVILECPSNLAVMTDRIRVKQIILNLVNNSRKFVSKGFIKVWAAVVDNRVHLYVEDRYVIQGVGIKKNNCLCLTKVFPFS
jgi:signal transduction histidine kinase